MSESDPGSAKLPQQPEESGSAAARAIHDAVADRPGDDGTRARAAAEVAVRMKEITDIVLESTGLHEIRSPEVRGELEAQSEELRKLAQQPELPPKGSDPAS